MALVLLLAAALRISAQPQLGELAKTLTSGIEAQPVDTGADLTFTAAPRGNGCIPIAVSAVAVVYKLEIAGDLRLSSEVISGILSGQITRWRDPAIAALNPGVSFPDLRIRFSVQADPGAYLKVSPKLEGEFRNEEGELGVIDAGYARRHGYYLAALQNIDGVFVAPTAHSVSRAAVGVKLPPELLASLIGARGPDSYPIAALIYGCGDAASKEFLQWLLHDGQKALTPAGFAPLPGFMVLLADQRLRSAVR